MRETVRLQIFAHDEPQRGGRGAPGSDWVARERAQSGYWIEFPGRIHGKYARAQVPGTKKARPGGFGPAGVGDAPVDILRLEVEPEFPRNSVAQSITGLSVQHHLWRPGSAA